MATMMDMDKDREVVKRTIKEKGPLTKAIESFKDRKASMSRQQASEGEIRRNAGMGSSKNVDAGSGRGTTTFGSDKTFKQAFAEARKAGQDTFNWKGKKYTTEMAGSKTKGIDSALEDAYQESMGTGSAERSYDAEPYVGAHDEETRMKKGGCVKMAKGGTASSRADGCAQRGKTKGKVV